MKNRTNNRRRHRLTSLLALVLLASCTLVPTALMQRPGPIFRPIPGPIPSPTPAPRRQSTDEQRQSPRPTPPPRRPAPDDRRESPLPRTRAVPIDSRVLRVPAPRSPIAFKALEMVDPRTGQPVTPDTMLTLDNRRQITAAKYYEQMNQLEAGLNKLGHSFRDQQRQVVTNEVVVDKPRILAQIRSTRFSQPNRRAAAGMERLAQANREYVRAVNPNFGKTTPRAFSPTVRSGLFEEKVGPLLDPVITPRRTGPGAVSKQRPDFVPGDREILGLGKDTEEAQLPGMSTNPGWAEGGVRATAVHVKASWPQVGFYVNYLNAPTGRLAPKYVWQVFATKRTQNPFGTFFKDWASEFDDQELVGWQTPGSMIRSGNAVFLLGSAQRQHLFVIDFAQVGGNPPAVPVDYLVRVIPVHADGSLAGYPSRPVLVTYGTQPGFVPPVSVPLPKPAKIPVNNIPGEEAPLVFGDPKVMSVDLKTWMKANGSLEEASASLGFDASCSVYGRPYPLLKVNAWGTIKPLQINEALHSVSFPGESSGGVSVIVGDFEELCKQCDKSNPGGVIIPFDKSTSIDKSFTLSFPIGPIDVSATVGLRGEIGVGGSILLSPRLIDQEPPFKIRAGPHMSITIFLEAGAGIGAGGYDVLAVGVDGTVNLISGSFLVRFSFNSDGGSYDGQVTDFRVFNGELNGWAKAGICPFCKKWTTNLYSWEGYDLLVSNPERAILFQGSF